jgi:hypothetical protein
MNIYPRLIDVVGRDSHQLLLSYSNGEKRVYDFAPNLTHKYYMPLADIVLFKQVKAVDGEIEWATGQDFCPHTLYDNSKTVI